MILQERNLPDVHSLRHQSRGIHRRDRDPNPFASFAEIRPADKGLLQETVQRFRPHSKNYEDSWGYIIQATRYGGFKWHDPQTGSLIFFGRKSHTDPALVVPSFFAEPAMLTSVVDGTQHALKAPQTIIKNASLEDVVHLLPYGFRQYEKHEGWSMEARFDDQTYPQQIVDLKKVIEARGKAYTQLRETLRKEHHMSIRTYQKTDRNEVLDVFASKDGNSRRTLEKSKGAYFASHVMYTTADIDKSVVTDNETGKIVGFLATSDISSETTALVASLFRPDARNTRLWSIYQTLVTKYYEGFHLATLGGCETEANYTFKREKFRPIEQLEKTHLVYTVRSQV